GMPEFRPDGSVNAMDARGLAFDAAIRIGIDGPRHTPSGPTLDHSNTSTRALMALATHTLARNHSLQGHLTVCPRHDLNQSGPCPSSVAVGAPGGALRAGRGRLQDAVDAVSARTVEDGSSLRGVGRCASASRGVAWLPARRDWPQARRCL